MKSIRAALVLVMTCGFVSLGCDDEIDIAAMCYVGVCAEIPAAAESCIEEVAECMRAEEPDNVEACIGGAIDAVCSEPA